MPMRQSTCIGEVVEIDVQAMEKKSLYQALDAFDQYRIAAHRNFIQPRQDYFSSLPVSDQKLLSRPPFSYLDNLSLIERAIDTNANIASAIVSYQVKVLKTRGYHVSKREWQGQATPSDIAIARATVRQLYRDWSINASSERLACHQPVLKDLACAFPSCEERSNLQVLVPGAGLGRLGYEICKAGYTAECNEMSYHQILASIFIIHRTAWSSSLELYPWALSFSNHVTRGDQLQNVLVPDSLLGDEGNGVTSGAEVSDWELSSGNRKLKYNAEEFVTCYSGYSHANKYDAVATVFFLDTAPNLLRYIESVRNCLKPVGIWTNIGPLLWNCAENGPAGRGEGDVDDDEACKARHSATSRGRESVERLEFTENEVLLLLERYGFGIEKHDSCKDEAGYIADNKSMLQYSYRLSHWVARKVL